MLLVDGCVNVMLLEKAITPVKGSAEKPCCSELNNTFETKTALW